MKFKESLKSWFGAKSFKLGGYSVAAGVLVAAIGVAVIVMTDSLPEKYTNLDMSGMNLYSISKETENIVKGLDKDVNIYLIAQESQKDKTIDQMLTRYADMNDHIKYSLKDPVKNPSFTSKYTDEQVSQNSIVVESEDKNKYIPYSDIYVTDYDYETGSQTTEFDAENSVTSAISYVSSDYTPKLYSLSGHGESELDSSFADLLKDRNTDSATLSLISEASVPTDADCVLINEPQSDLTENELERLKTYIDKGGNIIMVSGYTNKDFPTFNKLLEYYGCELEKALIVEGDPAKCIQGYNYFILPDISAHEITTPLTESNYFVMTPLAVNIKINDTEKATALLQTSSKAYTKSNVEDSDSLAKTDSDPTGTYTVGAAATTGSGDNESKLLLISSSGFLTQKIDAFVSGGNGDLFLNAFSWMSGREEGIAIHAKSLTGEQLTVPDSAAGVIGFIAIFLIPAAAVAAGVYVTVKRRKR